jgi:hypothetical protein
VERLFFSRKSSSRTTRHICVWLTVMPVVRSTSSHNSRRTRSGLASATPAPVLGPHGSHVHAGFAEHARQHRFACVQPTPSTPTASSPRTAPQARATFPCPPHGPLATSCEDHRCKHAPSCTLPRNTTPAKY